MVQSEDLFSMSQSYGFLDRRCLASLVFFFCIFGYEKEFCDRLWGFEVESVLIR